MRRRFRGSLGLFAAGIVLSFVLPIHAGFEHPLVLVQIGLLLGAVAVLPRDVLPRIWPTPESVEDAEAQDLLRSELQQMQTRSTLLRLGYLIALVVILLGVPWLRAQLAAG